MNIFPCVRVLASWVPSGKDSGGAPQLKGARWFSYVELKKCTSHFSESNEIGSGGYGKVNRLGKLHDGYGTIYLAYVTSYLFIIILFRFIEGFSLEGS